MYKWYVHVCLHVCIYHAYINIVFIATPQETGAGILVRIWFLTLLLEVASIILSAPSIVLRLVWGIKGQINYIIRFIIITTSLVPRLPPSFIIA